MRILRFFSACHTQPTCQKKWFVGGMEWPVAKIKKENMKNALNFFPTFKKTKKKHVFSPLQTLN